MTNDEYFEELIKILERRLSRMILIGEVRVAETHDIVQYFCEWLLRRPKLIAHYSPAAIASVALRQRTIEFFRAQHRQTPALPFVAGAEDPRMHMNYLDEEMWGPTGFAPVHQVPLYEFEDGDNTPKKGPNHIDKIDCGVDVEEVSENQMLLQALITELEPLQRQVFWLVDVEGYTVTEAAGRMKIRRERASINLGKAREKVRRIRDQWDA